MGKEKDKKANSSQCQNTKLNDEQIVEIQFEYLHELAKEKYDAELQREQDLINQSGQMQAAFSFLTAALFMALPVIMDNPGKLTDNFFLIVVSIIVFFLLLSLVLASLATWRSAGKSLDNITKIKRTIIEAPDWEKNLVKYNRLASQIEAWEEIQTDKEKKNDRRAILIIASMSSFYASIGAIVISFIVAMYFLWK